jgi:hypothetical protein
MGKQNKINELLDKSFISNKYEIKLTWRFFFYLFYILVSMFFVGHAYLNTYETWLAGLLWIQFIVSYLFSIFLIRRVD